MIPRAMLKAGDLVWLAELDSGKARVERAIVRRKPRGRTGIIWLDDASRMTAFEWQIRRSEGEAYVDLAMRAAETLESATADADAANAALAAFSARTVPAKATP